nr:DUF2027 domain-containing protein [Leptospira kmetyi]
MIGKHFGDRGIASRFFRGSDIGRAITSAYGRLRHFSPSSWLKNELGQVKQFMQNPGYALSHSDVYGKFMSETYYHGILNFAKDPAYALQHSDFGRALHSAWNIYRDFGDDVIRFYKEQIFTVNIYRETPALIYRSDLGNSLGMTYAQSKTLVKAGVAIGVAAIAPAILPEVIVTFLGGAEATALVVSLIQAQLSVYCDGKSSLCHDSF